ncbi:hypothetical protein QE412_003088 [Microbacterium trichothecenolyticum]|uniref:Uncharacterized protein n=1 Tax=Microbacterium trichothecenolyticum TaxID=69370 RepID=A0ABU0TYC5_MICTR|nr:hypothetical protein [Microbacterium trichothecenolyticum]MDQ1124515.1 hypothetical protein [Microbacterium trichothecenolyticum]
MIAVVEAGSSPDVASSDRRHARAQRERAGYADALALTSRELMRVMAGAFGQAHPVEQLRDAPADLDLRHAEVLEGERHVLGGRAAAEQPVRLEDRADATSRGS